MKKALYIETSKVEIFWWIPKPIGLNVCRHYYVTAVFVIENNLFEFFFSVCDFGFARELGEKVDMTVCGTDEWMVWNTY